MSDEALTTWLLDSDPALRWQVERDLVGAPPEVWEATREARRSSEEYLLERGLFRRLSTGEPVVEGANRFSYPMRWYCGRHVGEVWFDVDVPAGEPSKWLTLSGTRVLDWWDA